jgi:hypothetical protein
MPLAAGLEAEVLRLVRLKRTLSPRQLDYFKDRRYTYLTGDQMELAATVVKSEKNGFKRKSLFIFYRFLIFYLPEIFKKNIKIKFNYFK